MLQHMPFRPLRVLVAGGGFAAAEALLALRAHAGDRVALELIVPDPVLPFRPAATVAPFTAAPVDRFDLGVLAEETGATLTLDHVAAVAPDAHRVRLGSDGVRGYDVLVLALGARARSAVPGALTVRDQRDGAHLERLVADLRTGGIDSLALTVPPGVSWSLPMIELALLAAAEADEAGTDTAVTLVLPERAPLSAFGDLASATVAEVLFERGVRVVTGVSPRMVDQRGLHLVDGSTIVADRVLAAPALTGRRVSGVPANFGGFVTTDPCGGVTGLEDVHAAGDMTSFPIKQGGLATQQAEAAALAIAARAGAPVPLPAPELIIRAQLFGAPSPMYLRAELDAAGRPVPGTSEVSGEPLWWPATTMFGRHVSPWMAGHTAASHAAA